MDGQGRTHTDTSCIDGGILRSVIQDRFSKIYAQLKCLDVRFVRTLLRNTPSQLQRLSDLEIGQTIVRHLVECLQSGSSVVFQWPLPAHCRRS